MLSVEEALERVLAEDVVAEMDIRPLTYGLEVLHAALLGPISWQMALHLGTLLAFAVLLFALTIVILRRRLD